MKKIILSFLSILCFLSLSAQEVAEQVLVFRNTGEVNLFYSDRLDSIVCSLLDKDSVIHEEPVSQIFYSKDTTMLIPLAEIDSVAIGERNVMEFKTDVKELLDADLSWIIRIEENTIYYRQDTPQDILPSVGQKLFCGFSGSPELTELFPYGLSARVVSVQPSADEISVTVENVELDEIFSKFFYAGRISETVPLNAKHRAPVNTELGVSVSVPLGKMGEIGVDGRISIHGEAVIHPLKHYYSADLTADYGFGINVLLRSEESGEVDYEEIIGRCPIPIPHPVLGKVLNLEAAFGAFAEVSAELTLGFEMERMYHRKILWTRQDGDNTFEVRNAGGNEPYEDSARLDLTLDGSVFFGPLLQLKFAVVGDVVGAKAKVKMGPENTGHFNLGMIRQMHDYNPQLYGEAKLSACNRLSFEGYVTNRRYIVAGDVEEHRIIDLPLRWAQHEINLFPNYVETRGTQVTINNETEVSVATKTDEEIAHEVESGFEILDEQTNEVIDSIFVDVIEAECEEVQGISAEFEIPAQENQSLIVRPIFHYAGNTISAAPVHVLKDFQIQPIVFSGSNGVVTYAASYPFTGEVTSDSTNYRAGAYLPIPVRDSVFQKEPSAIEFITYITGNQVEELVGTWIGKEGEEDIVLVFNEDGSGSLNDDVFSYELNVPQSGQILLTFNDENTTPIVLTLLRLHEGTMQYRRNKGKIVYTLFAVR